MSDSSESTPPLDLSDLRLMPKWVAEFGKSSSTPAADHAEGDARGRDRRDGPGPRDQRRGFGGGRQDGPPRGERRSFDKPRGPSDRGPRPPGDRRDDRRGGTGGGYRQDRDRQHGRGGREDRGGYGNRPQFEQAPAPVTGLTVQVEPEAKATEAMAAMIRTAGKAYSVFDAARLVLASGDRFHVKFKMAPDASARLHAVPTDGSLWLSKEEALAHVIHGDAINAFYKVDEVELEVPKGNFTSVAVCGMSGALLGPPSHHSYQTTLHKIHREQFSHMPFEDYKRRVRTDSTPEAVEKWKESQKHGMQWTWLKGEVAEGEEPKTFKTRAEMESHFRTHHADSLVGEVTEATVSGNIPKRLLAPSLYNHLRRAVDEGRKHLLSTAQQLCSGFERHGLKLFKRRGGKLWVSRTRPRLLEGNVVLSERIARMVEIIKTQPGIPVKKLIESVAPSAAAPAAPATTRPETAPVGGPAMVAEALGASSGVVLPPIEEAAPAESVETEVTATAAPAEEVAQESPAPAAAPAAVALPTAPAAAAAHHEWSGEQLHALQDLHWLNSEGYVIEYADGVVFPGVTEPPPPKPKSPAKEKAAEGAPAESQSEAPAPAPAAEENISASADADTDVTSETFTEEPPVVTDSTPELTTPETEPPVETETVVIEAAAETEAPVEVEAEVEAASSNEAAPETTSDEGSEQETEPASTEEQK